MGEFVKLRGFAEFMTLTEVGGGALWTSFSSFFLSSFNSRKWIKTTKTRKLVSIKTC